MDPIDIPKHYRTIDLSAIIFLVNFGPQFTDTPKGHIETDIAGAASVAGLMLLRATVTDLDKYEPGAVILSEVYSAQEELFNFMRNVVHTFGMQPDGGWTTLPPQEHQPMFSTLEMTRKLEQPFYNACSQANLPKEYYPHAAALTAIKLVGAGLQTNRLSLDVGKGLAVSYVVAGSKTVPYPLLISD